jgi:RNA polymerase sigma-70 factor, ECF subfamily
MGESNQRLGSRLTGYCLVRSSKTTRYLETAGDSIKRMNFRVYRGKESELIAAILDGDTQLYHQLIRPYERSVYIVSLSYMKNEKDAEEVAQETFIRAFRDLWTFPCDLKFSMWLIGIAINEARSRLRRRAAIRVVSREKPRSKKMSGSPALLRHWCELPSDMVEREDIRELLHQAVQMLPNIYQRVFLLHEVEELNINDTARILGISTQLVKIALHRARIRLQRLLAPKLKAINSTAKKMQFQ